MTYEEMARYFQRACDWFVCGRAMFDAQRLPNGTSGIVPGLVDGDVTCSGLERWSLPTDFGQTYLSDLADSGSLRVLTGLTATEIQCFSEASAADGLKARTEKGIEVLIKAKAFVIACGGLESTRLLMCSRGPDGGQLGAGSGHLGKFYMAHNEGVVANFRCSRRHQGRRFSDTSEISMGFTSAGVLGSLMNSRLKTSYQTLQRGSPIRRFLMQVITAVSFHLFTLRYVPH